MNNREQLEQIRAELLASAKKDSSLPTVSTLDGSELVPIVKDGANKVVLLSEVLGMSSGGFTLISDMNISLASAIDKVPVDKRKPGMIISYYDKKAKDWVLTQFKGFSVHQWSDTSMWSASGSNGLQTKLIKESDLECKHKNAEEGTFAVARDAKGRLHLWFKTCQGWEKIDSNLDNKACKYQAIGSRDAKRFVVECEHRPCEVNVPYRRGNNIYMTNECGNEEFLYSVSDSFNEYEITVDQVAGGTIVVSHTGMVMEGTLVTVSVIPDEGKQLVRFSDSVSGNTGAKPYSFIVREDRCISAVFEDVVEDKYDAYITASPLVGYGSLQVEFAGIIFKNGTKVEPDEVLVDGVAVTAMNKTYTTPGKHTMTVEISKGGMRWRKSFSLEVKAPMTCPATPQPTPTSGKLTIVGLDKDDVSVTVGRNSSKSGYVVTGTPSLSVSIKANRKDGAVFSHFLVNGSIYRNPDGVFDLDSSIGEYTLEPVYQYSPITPRPSTFPYVVRPYVGDNGTIREREITITDENGRAVFEAIPNPGYEVDPSSKLIYTHATDYPNTTPRITFRLKSNRAYTGGRGYNAINDTSVLVTPNECHIDGRGVGSFSVTINANEIPYNGIASVIPSELSSGVQVQFSENKTQAIITYLCQILNGRKPVVKLTDNAGRYVDVLLSDFKPAIPVEPTKQPISFSDGSGFSVDNRNKTINIANQCFLGEESDEARFTITIQYTGDFKEYQLERYSTQMVSVVHNENNKTITMTFFCKALNGLTNGIVRLIDWLGNTWRVVLGNYKEKPVTPPSTPRRHVVSVNVDDNTRISGYTINGQQSNASTSFEFDHGAYIEIRVSPANESDTHSYEVVSVGGQSGTSFAIAELLSDATIDIVTRAIPKEVDTDGEVTVNLVYNPEEVAYFTIRKGESSEEHIDKQDMPHSLRVPKGRFTIAPVPSTQYDRGTINGEQVAYKEEVLTKDKTYTFTFVRSTPTLVVSTFLDGVLTDLDNPYTINKA